MSQAGNFNNGSTPPPPGSVITLEGNSGGPVGPNIAGNIDVVGSGAMDVTGNPGTNTLTVTVATANTAQLGVVELATNAETITGTDATRAVTPASLSAKLGTQTDHAVAIGDGATNSFTWSNVGTDGQLLIGATGADPAFATLTSTGGTVIFTPGPNSLNLEASGGSGSGITVTADTGSAAPIANVLTLKGAVSGNIETVGLGNNLTVAVSGTTNHAVQVGNASGSLTSVGPGTTNTVLLGNTGFNPSFGLVPNAALVNKSITFANGNSINCSPSGPIDLGSGLIISVSGTTPHAVQVGAVTGGLSNVAVGITNTVLLGNTGADPSFGKVPNGALVSSSITVNGDQNISVSGSPVSLGGTVSLSFPNINQYELVTANGSGAAESLPAGTGTAGQVLTSNGAGAYPTWQPSGSSTGSLIATQFTSSGTWTKNPNTQLVEIIMFGSGGGGGSGSRGSSTTSPDASCGGGGGAPSGALYMQMPGFAWGTTNTVTVAAGGTGGSGVSINSTNGNAGTAGGVCSVGLLAMNSIANNGLGGLLSGTPPVGLGGGVGYHRYLDGLPYGTIGGGSVGTTPTMGFFVGTRAGSGYPSSSGSGSSAVDSPLYMGMGLGGGGRGSLAGGSNDGGNGGNVRSCFDSTATVGGTILTIAGIGGTSLSVNGGNGADGAFTNGFMAGGAGGGGGAGVLTGLQVPGNGGHGGYPGGGGGGGAGGINGSAHPSGSGGNGGDALVLIIEHLGTLTVV